MEAFFLSRESGQRFCIFHPACNYNTARGAIIYVHPFAEEMNKARRMAALQAHVMANAGFDVLQIDLLGCGDSSGEFADATWQAWQEDIRAGHIWLRTRSQAPLTLWGLRAGCLLAADVAAKLPEKSSFIFWQPVISGKQHWQQFMRLKLAGGLTSGSGKAVNESIKQQLTAGQTVEIAGYPISPVLADSLEKAELKMPDVHSGRVIWLELSMRDDAMLAPLSKKHVEEWQASGINVEAKVVYGPGFWQTIEIEDAPKLIAATMSALESRQ